MENAKSVFKTIQKRGWAMAKVPKRDLGGLGLALLDIARSLGSPIASRRGSLIDILRPTASEAAHPRSLSATNGLNSLPLHTDTAHWAKPCRFVLLSCENPGEYNCATKLLDIETIEFTFDEIDLLKRTPILIRNGRLSFYGTVFSEGRKLLRYDRGCMEPVHKKEINPLNLFENKIRGARCESIQWEQGTVVLIDNWRLLHARNAVENHNSARTLVRVLVQ